MIAQLLVYSLKAAFTLSLLYLPYIVFLQKERFFRLNRVVLLSIVMLSLALPLCNISMLSMDDLLVVQAAHQQMMEIGMPVQVADATMLDEVVVTRTVSGISLFQLLAILYFVGLVITVLVRCIQLGILNYTLHHRNLWTRRTEDGIRICCRTGQFSPYSWMNTIVISESDWNDNHNEIIMHESGHIRAQHSMDMLLLMLCQALQWYNPLAWMLASSFSDVHEYEADDYVLRQGINIRDYQLLLIKKAVGASSYTFANSFNHSLTKKRITMMQKSNQNPWRRSRVLYVIPVAALTLSVFATPKFINPVSEVASQPSVPADKVSYNPANEQVVKTKTTETETNSSPQELTNTEDVVPDVIAEYPGGTAEMYKFLAMNIRYPQEAQRMGIQGRIIMKLTINTKGEITNVKPVKMGDINGENAKELAELHVNAYKLSVERNGGEPASEEELEAVREGNLALITEAERVIKKMPNWTPAKKNGQPVDCEFMLPITFRLT